MPPNKNQHYIPKSYFKLFTNGEDRIFVYNLNRQAVFESSVNHLCCGDYFYSKDPSVDTLFSQIEGSNIEVLRKIIRDENLSSLSIEELRHLKSYILFQHGRTKSSGETIEQMANEFFDILKPSIAEFAESEGKPITEKGLRNARIAFERPVGMPLVVSMLSGILIYDLVPALLVNRSKVDFVFGDAPVVLFNSFFNDKFKEGTTGFASTGLQIFFPINSRFMLLLFDSNYYSIEKRDGGRVLVSKESDIQRLNGLQIITTDDNIYFQNHQMADKIKQRHLELMNNRPRKKVECELISAVSNNDTSAELVRTSRVKYHYNLGKLSFMSHKRSSNKRISTRNEELARVHSQVVQAVLKRKISNMDDLTNFLKGLDSGATENV